MKNIIIILLCLLFLFLLIKPIKFEENNNKKFIMINNEMKIINTKINYLKEEILCSYNENSDTNLYNFLELNKPILSLPSDSLYLIQDKNISNYIKNSNEIIDSLYKIQYNITKERRKIQKMVKYKIDSLNNTPHKMPVSNADVIKITSQFGTRITKINKVKKLVFHEGIDMSLKENSPIYATADGIVEMVRIDSKSYGKRIVIKHKYNYKTVYAHLNKLKVLEGDTVKSGDVIAYSGNTGRSLGPHLHYEVQYNEKSKNPLNYMKLNDFITIKKNKLNF